MLILKLFSDIIPGIYAVEIYDNWLIFIFI
jgi:hypothetical protein